MCIGKQISIDIVEFYLVGVEHDQHNAERMTVWCPIKDLFTKKLGSYEEIISTTYLAKLQSVRQLRKGKKTGRKESTHVEEETTHVDEESSCATSFCMPLQDHADSLLYIVEELRRKQGGQMNIYILSSFLGSLQQLLRKQPKFKNLKKKTFRGRF